MLNRREILTMGGIAGLALSRRLWVADAAAADASGHDALAQALDAFVAQYLDDWNVPGLTLALVDRSGVRRLATYGVERLDLELPLEANRLFQIGSISKSFVALCLMQLRDEGKLDLAAPIAHYLPWLRIDSTFEPLTVHHLMTHSAGLPDGALWPVDASVRHRPRIPPGQQFHYCNMGWQALGDLIELLDGRLLGASLRARILEPLGMRDTSPITDFGMRARLATSYWPKFGDRPYARDGLLSEAPSIIATDGAGCVSSTAADMARYLKMLIDGGLGPTGPLVSADGFARFSAPHIPAGEFGAGARYGYGIVVDQLDGHRRLRHTGGMVSFASALEVDLDGGFGVFVSVNAMQGFRPTAVAEYALRSMRAVAEHTPMPALPPSIDPLTVFSAERFEGRFVDVDGEVLEIRAADDRLVWWSEYGPLPLEPAIDAPNAFHIHHASYTRFLLVAQSRDDSASRGAVEAFAWGERLWVRQGVSWPRPSSVPDGWGAFPGHYRNEDPWIGSARVVLRAGRLWWNGVVPMDPAGESGVFYLRDAEQSLEWVRFRDIGGGKAHRLELSGVSLARVSTD